MLGSGNAAFAIQGNLRQKARLIEVLSFMEFSLRVRLYPWTDLGWGRNVTIVSMHCLEKGEASTINKADMHATRTF